MKKTAAFVIITANICIILKLFAAFIKVATGHSILFTYIHILYIYMFLFECFRIDFGFWRTQLSEWEHRFIVLDEIVVSMAWHKSGRLTIYVILL